MLYPYTGDRASSATTPPSGHSNLILNEAVGKNLFFIRSDPEQIRSFRYFLQISAPAIASSFNAPFWTEEIPRACHDDPAIWHAVVSLGSIYEDHVALSMAAKTTKPYSNAFALKQFNQSVRQLLDPKFETMQNKWRAVVVSIIFTTACLVEGLYEQARLHFASGCTLFNEIEEAQSHLETQARPFPHSDFRPDSDTPTTSTAFSMRATRSVLAGLEMWVHGINNGPGARCPSMLSPANRSTSLWDMYTAPVRSAEGERLLTVDNLKAVNRAAESFLISNLHFTWENNAELEKLRLNPNAERIKYLRDLQQPLFKGYKELHKTMVDFRREIGEHPQPGASESLEQAQLRLGLDYLSLYVASRWIFAIGQPKNFVLDQSIRTFQAACTRVVDLAERIIDREAKIILPNRPAACGPFPSIAIPISAITVVAPTLSVRVRAMNILKHPRVEGFLDGRQTAALSQAIMMVEAEADQEYRRQQEAQQEEGSDADGARGGCPESSSSLSHTLDLGDEVLAMSRCCVTHFQSTERGEGVVLVRTWRDLVDGSNGRTLTVTW